MGTERIAIAWVLVVVLGLLLGLLVLVVAFGVVRHLRRQRPRGDRPRRRGGDRSDDADEPAEWRTSSERDAPDD